MIPVCMGFSGEQEEFSNFEILEKKEEDGVFRQTKEYIKLPFEESWDGNSGFENVSSCCISIIIIFVSLSLLNSLKY